ncbi:MAG: 4a-hydroxytetrahydrobiopterin dehydratase [Desulfobacterales bacterium]|nr:4a-hydroxytetrahydrobiopterin dehydratase [Desulfobacterales bacterium]
MKDLANSKCVPCEKGAPLITEDELTVLQPQIPDWDIIEDNGIKKLRKVFKFKNFVKALSFTNKIGNLAEDHFHHPTIILDWGRVEVLWTTHKIKGLHENDVIMAAKTDLLT